MLKKTSLQSIGAGLLLVGLAFFTPQEIRADMHSFNIRVYHGINGTSLGLSKDLPVEATVELDGEVLAVLPLNFGDEIETQLPAGTYKITVYSVELDVQLDSMTVGPVDIPPGVDVNLHAKLSSNKTPIIKAKVK